jgi:hypothetical protein
VEHLWRWETKAEFSRIRLEGCSALGEIPPAPQKEEEESHKKTLRCVILSVIFDCKTFEVLLKEAV